MTQNMCSYFYYLLFTLILNKHAVLSIVSYGPPIPMGLFIPIASWSSDVNQLREELNYICQNHRVSTGQNQVIRTIVVTEIAKNDQSADLLTVPPKANDQLLWSPLIEAILPYFPGGNGPCQFEKAYVGAIALPPPPNADIASGGLRNPTYRAHLLARQKSLAQQFAGNVSASANPNVLWDWYIMQEMCLDYVIYDFYDNTLKSTEAWADFFAQSMLDLNSVKPNRGFLISPMFQFHTSYYPIGSTGDNFIRERWQFMFNKIQQTVAPTIPACSSAATCPFALDLQDHVGLAGDTPVNFTKEVAAEQFGRLKSVFPFNNLKMNVEQFRHVAWAPQVPESYPNADCEEVREREQYYATQGIQLGNAWFMDQWYSCNRLGSPGVCETGWTRFDDNCYKKIASFKTWTDANNICQSVYGAQLVSIHSKAENDFVVSLDRPAGDVSIWIGFANPFIYTANPYVGTKDGAAIFRWTDGKPVDYLNWTPGWPTALTDSSGVEYKCGAIYTANGGGQWGNAGCGWQTNAFVCKKPALSKIFIRAQANNKIVSSWNAGANALQARVDQAYSWEKFEVTANTDGTISLRSLINGEYVCADLNAGAKLLANKDTIGTWEKFKPIYNSDGTVSLIAQANGKYVCADLNYSGTELVPLVANKDVAYSWESFWLKNV